MLTSFREGVEWILATARGNSRDSTTTTTAATIEIRIEILMQTPVSNGLIKNEHENQPQELFAVMVRQCHWKESARFLCCGMVQVDDVLC